MTRSLTILAVLALAGTSCGQGEESPVERTRPKNLVVIVLDALPAAGVGAYGYARNTTPHLDKLAARGVRFDAAYSGASYTLASVSSMFTGLSPAAHGVANLDSNVLPRNLETFAEALSDAGFATAGFSSNPHITREGGFAQGFDVFMHFGRERFEQHLIPRRLAREPIEFFRENADRRKLVWIHVLPPHQPYDPPSPHAELFGAEATDRELGMTDRLVEIDGKVAAGSAEALAIRARYDAGVHYADYFVGNLLRLLAQEGAEEDTAYCVVSDHGEAFGEHGRLLHGTTVFEEMVHVPLVLWWPGVEPGVATQLVSTVDLAPTLAELLDVPFSEGRSFLSAVSGEHAVEPVLARTVGKQPMWALRTERWTLLEQKSLGRRLLYDRALDRGETVDLLLGDDAEALEVADELARVLAKRLAKDRQRAHGPVRSDDTHKDEIEALGYLDLETGDLDEDQ